MIYIMAFGLYFVGDYTWAMCVSATSGGRPLSAGFWAVVLHLTQAVGVLTIVASPWTVVPIAIGGGLGTYLATLNKRKTT